MTEYDYSPEAYERFMESQNKIARWVNTTNRVYPDLRNPFDPATPAPDLLLALPNGRYNRYQEDDDEWDPDVFYKKRSKEREREVYRAKDHTRPKALKSMSHTQHNAESYGDSRPPLSRPHTSPNRLPHARRASYDTYTNEKHAGSKYDVRSGSRYDLTSYVKNDLRTGSRYDLSSQRQPYAIYDYSQTQPQSANRSRSSSVARPAPLSAPIVPALPPPPTRQKPNRTQTSPPPPPPQVYQPASAPAYPSRYPIYAQPQQQPKQQRYQAYTAEPTLPPPPNSAPATSGQQPQPQVHYAYPDPRPRQRQQSYSFAPPVIPEPTSLPTTKPPPLLKRLFTGLTGSGAKSQPQPQSQPQSPDSPSSRSGGSGSRGSPEKVRERDREESVRPKSTANNMLRRGERDRADMRRRRSQ